MEQHESHSEVCGGGAGAGDAALVQRVLSDGASADYRDRDGSSPLLIAITQVIMCPRRQQVGSATLVRGAGLVGLVRLTPSGVL